MLVGAVALIAALGSAAVLGKAWMSAREDLAAQKAQTEDARSQVKVLQGAMLRQRRLVEAAEQARIELAAEVADLEAQGQQVVTQIQTKWRDRVIREAYPVAVECSGVELPPDILSLLECARTGGCAVPAPAGGSADRVSHTYPAG